MKLSCLRNANIFQQFRAQKQASLMYSNNYCEKWNLLSTTQMFSPTSQYGKSKWPEEQRKLINHSSDCLCPKTGMSSYRFCIATRWELKSMKLPTLIHNKLIIAGKHQIKTSTSNDWLSSSTSYRYSRKNISKWKKIGV